MFGVHNHLKHLPRFCVVNDVFSKEEIQKIIDLEELQTFEKGKIGTSTGAPSLNEEIRDSEVTWIEYSHSSQWLFEKFGDLVSKVNDDFFLFDLEGFPYFQYTVYKENGHYDWHIDMEDMSFNQIRKISASIILSDPESYEGGELNLIINGRVDAPVALKPKMGDVVFFASWTPHKVSPVTQGTRKSLVCWIMGKR